MQPVIQILLSNLYLFAAMALTTLGIALTFKTAGIVNFAQPITATAGVFAAAYVIRSMGGSIWMSLLAGIVVCFVLGWLYDVALLRHSDNIAARVMIILGLIILVSASIPIVFGMIPYNYGRFLTGNLDFKLFGMALTTTKNGLLSFVVATIVILMTFAALNFTKWGLGIRATASNRVVASMMGINTNRLTALSWAISCALGALGGIFYASQTSLVDVGMLAVIQTTSLMAFVLGGYNSFYGPMIGAVIIPLILSMAALFSGLWANVILYVFVLLVILVKPQGLFGKVSVKKV